jgi:hypothetical protein
VGYTQRRLTPALAELYISALPYDLIVGDAIQSRCKADLPSPVKRRNSLAAQFRIVFQGNLLVIDRREKGLLQLYKQFGKRPS